MPEKSLDLYQVLTFLLISPQESKSAVAQLKTGTNQKTLEMRGHALKALTILAIVKFGQISSTCPSKCSCENNIITCIRKELQDVPIFETVDINPVTIDLSGNKLISIDIFDFSFERNTEVKEVYLNNSAITDIEDRCFDELVSLQELYLNNNNLKSVPKNMISENVNMVVLDMSNNIFERFPTINSTSLEVIALANAGISSVPETGLSNLPNLRLLLLQENKLKQLSPTVFDNINKFFFIKLTYNLWSCNCDTVKLFQFLVSNGYTEITKEEPIQCLTEDRDFVDIYYYNGTTWFFNEKCNTEVSKEVSDIFRNFRLTKLLLEDKTNQSKTLSEGTTIASLVASDDTNLETEDAIANSANISLVTKPAKAHRNRTIHDEIIPCGSEEFYEFMKIILLLTVPIAFLLGMLFGCYLMYAYRKSYMKTHITDSSKRLLSPSIEQVVKEECA